MTQPMDEQERLMLIQHLIDRLLYLDEDKRKEFLSYLDALYCVYPIPREIKYGKDAFIGADNCNENF
jgi:hypothetical protein